MEYNTGRNKLIISEYGRNVQKMVEHALQLEDREKRTRLAHLIVNVMGQLNPNIKEVNDYKQKLWDHLHIISDYRLDVDGPYPAPSREALEAKPDKLKYQSNGIKFKHYGKNIENVIEKVAEMEEGEDKEEMTRIIANHLKKSYLTWNRESITDEVIAKHLDLLSEGKLVLPEDMVLDQTKEILARQNKKRKKPTKPTQQNRKYRGKRS